LLASSVSLLVWYPRQGKRFAENAEINPIADSCIWYSIRDMVKCSWFQRTSKVETRKQKRGAVQ
jgi:hypothetical protein